MRVLYVIDALGEGGTERSLADLLPPLVARGIDPSICILRSRGDEGVEPHLRAAGYPIEILRGTRLVGHVAQLRARSKALGTDLVHSMLLASNLRARTLRALGGPPLVNSLVNVSYGPERLVNPALTARKLEVVRRTDQVTARFVDLFHAVSAPVALHAQEALRLAPERIRVVERGRDPDLLGPWTPERRAAARERLGIATDRPVLVNLARHEHQKGLDTLLRATPAIVDALPAVVLQAGRRGAATGELEELHTSLGLGEAFRFLGHRKDIGDLLAAADLFAFPSRYEGMPGVLIEAMALRLPLVASDVPTVTEVLEPEGNARVVPVDDPEALATACIAVLRDDVSRAAMASRSREIYEARFTMERSGEAMARLYRDVVASRSSRRGVAAES